MFLDGEADDQVARHLKQCPHCREKAKYQTHLQNRVVALLHRVMCPAPEDLRDYHFRLLSQSVAADVKEHLTRCPYCTRELALLNEYLGDEMVPAMELSPLETVKAWIEVLVAHLAQRGPGTLTPAFGLRGGEEDTFVYEVNNITLGLDIEDDPEQPGRKDLGGTIIGIDVRGLQVHLWQADQLVTTALVDQIGSFVIPHLVPGRYELIVSGPEMKIHIPELQVGV
jgi:hypothetical protein